MAGHIAQKGPELTSSYSFFLKFFLYFSVQLHSLLHSNLNTIVPLTNCHGALLQNFLPSWFFYWDVPPRNSSENAEEKHYP
jgi:hypothetical protein